ncbi:MAG: hypothetical protein ACOY93_17930 [Bacillota bacterium]
MRVSLGLRVGAAILLGTAVGCFVFIMGIFVGIAVGWAFVFGDGNGHENWFLPLVNLVARSVASLCIPVAYWLLVPEHRAKGRPLLLVAALSLAAALLLLPWDLKL